MKIVSKLLRNRFSGSVCIGMAGDGFRLFIFLDKENQGDRWVILAGAKRE